MPYPLAAPRPNSKAAACRSLGIPACPGALRRRAALKYSPHRLASVATLRNHGLALRCDAYITSIAHFILKSVASVSPSAR